MECDWQPQPGGGSQCSRCLAWWGTNAAPCKRPPEPTNYDIHLYKTRDGRWRTRVQWADADGVERCEYGTPQAGRDSALEASFDALAMSEATYDRTLTALFRAWQNGTTGGVPVSLIDPSDLEELARDDYVVIRANSDVALTENGARFAFSYLYT